MDMYGTWEERSEGSLHRINLKERSEGREAHTGLISLSVCPSVRPSGMELREQESRGIMT